MIAGLLVTIITGAGLWFAFGTYARIETAQGILTTDKPTAKVYSPRTGVAVQFFVREGDLVAAGQSLAVVNADVQDGQGSGVAANSAAAVQAQLGYQEKQIELVEESYSLEVRRLQGIIQSSTEQISTVDSARLVQEQIVTSQKSLLDQVEGVVERGFISRNEFERRRQSYLSAVQQQLQLNQQRENLARQAAEAAAQLRNSDVAREREIATINSATKALEQQRIQLVGAQAFVVTAPIAGRVTAIQTGVGQSVQPTIPILIVVPEDAKLLAYVYAPTRAIGFVRPGQEARLSFDAFPYQRFGTAVGRVEAVSGSVLDPRETSVPLALEEPVYRVTVALDSQALRARGGLHALQPGMTLKASLVLERQSFLEWLLTPLAGVMRKSN